MAEEIFLSFMTTRQMRSLYIDACGEKLQINFGDGIYHPYQRTRKYYLLKINRKYDVQIRGKTIRTIRITNNNISFLKFQNCTSLRLLDCSNNCIPELNLSGCPQLKILNCSENLLRSIDLSFCKNLEIAEVHNNLLTSILLPFSTPLRLVNCKFNPLPSKELHSLIKKLPTQSYSDGLFLGTTNTLKKNDCFSYLDWVCFLN